jgi:predicted AAA+ superfamily ATPase
MYENAVLVKLVTLHDSISYWSSLKSEVDFIVDSKAINVTSSSCIPEREREGLSEFFNIHKNFSLVLICSKSGKDTVSLMDFIKR